MTMVLDWQLSVRFNSRVSAIAMAPSGIESVLAFSVFEAIVIADKSAVASENGSIVKSRKVFLPEQRRMLVDSAFSLERFPGGPSVELRNVILS
jgi:hypothetical protein